MKVKILPPAMEVLGATRKGLKRLGEIGIVTQITELQKTALLHTARILQKNPEI